MIYSQQKQEEATSFLTLGGLKFGTPKATQQWVDEFLASRAQGISQRTLEFYRDILYRFIGIDLTSKGINNWLTSLNLGNARLNYYNATKVFCNWLHKSGKINDNPINLVSRPINKKVILPAITKDQLDILLNATDNSRDKCILNLLLDSGCRLSELVGIKDTDFDWKRRTVIHLWYGEADRNVPLQMGEYYKRAIPEYDATFYPDEGHFIMYSRAKEILTMLIS